MRAIDPAVLVAKLKELFPDRCPAPDATDRSVWIAVGAVSVVRWIEQEYQPHGAEAMEPDESLDTSSPRRLSGDPRSWRP
jgi:hypothetical protein